MKAKFTVKTSTIGLEMANVIHTPPLLKAQAQNDETLTRASTEPRFTLVLPIFHT
ncbi:hypothetical protein [Paraburkholderia flagellata]|uniref:hypothetical protein n=1 Tax=Paraburkholderia flagellata TaxID=2883241 RepID=UPI001F42C666|nr:hypothetical protein [Paraburkholderia flagellata]